MASLFKPTYTRKNPKTGERELVKSKKWYGQYQDAHGQRVRVPLATDKAVANAMLNERVKRVQRGEAGLCDPFEESRRLPLLEHLESFIQSL